MNCRSLILMLCVIALTTTANAEVFITVDGVPDPEMVTVSLGDSFSIGLWDDIWGGDADGTFILGVSLGAPASLDILDATFIFPFHSQNIELWNDPDIAELFEIESPFVVIEAGWIGPERPTLKENRVVDGIGFHCEGLGDVTLKLFDGGGLLIDSQVIHQIIPEPATLVVLAFGTLLGLRKRR